MSISIAMCTYNGARYLRTQLESFAQQTMLPDELVVCDDGSTDLTLQILENFRSSAQFTVRIFRNKVTLGYTQNFEQAIMHCKGDLIALSDQDDIWYPQKLALLSMSFAQDASVGGVFSDGDLLNTDLRSTGETIWRSHRFTSKEQQSFITGSAADILFRRNIVTGMTMMFRSSLCDKFLPIPQSWVHDAWIAFMLVAHARLIPSNERLVGYRTHAIQQIGSPVGTKQKFHRLSSLGISEFLRCSRTNNLMEYEKTAVQFDDLAEYLRNTRLPRMHDLAVHASTKAIHARNAIFILSLPVFRRLGVLMRSVGEYQRYSSPGLQNLLRDLIL